MYRFIIFFLFSTLLYCDTYLNKEEKEWINNNSNISIAMINNFSPFSFEQNSTHEGFTLELLRLIEEKSGLHFNIETSKWSVALEKFKNNKVDMISDISFTDERKTFTLFTDAYYNIPTFVFGLKSDNNYIDNSSLVGKKVGVSKNIFYINELKANNITPIEFDSSVAKANALVVGDIDYFLASYTSGINAIAKQSLITIKPIDELKSIKKEDLRFGVTPSKPILHSIIQKSLQQIPAQVINQLAIKWVLVNDNVKFDESISFTDEEKQYIKNAKKIKVGSIDTYTPFSFMKNGSKVGFTQDILSIIAQKSGLEFEKISGTWPEVFGSFEKGSIDIISEFSLRPERLEYTLYTQPYYEIPIGIFTRKDFGTYKDIQSLKGKKVGVVKGSYLLSILDKIPSIEIVELSSTDNKFYALDNKEVDVVLSNAMSLYRVTESLLLKNIKLAGYFTHKEVKTEDLRFGIRIEQPILASIINKTLDSIDYAQLTKLKNKWIYQTNQMTPADIPLNAQEQNYILNNKVIKVSNEMDWVPFDFVNNGKPSGYSIELLNLLASKLGLEIQYINGYSWDQLIELFKENKIDLLHSLTFNESRANLGIYSQPYLRYQTHYITQDSIPFIHSIKEVEDKTFVVGKNWSTDLYLQKHYPNIKVVRVNSTKEILDTVASNENYIGLLNRKVAQFLIQKNNMLDLKISGWCKEIDNEDSQMLYFLAHNEAGELISILNKALDSLSLAEIEELNAKWFGSDLMKKDPQLTLLEKKFIEQNKKIKIKVNPNNPPFEFEQNGKAVGIAVDYVKLSANNVGLDVEFVLDDSDDLTTYNIMETTKTPYSTKLFEIKNKNLINRFSFGRAYLSYPIMIITNKKSQYINSLANLSNKTIVLENNSILNEFLKKDHPRINIKNVQTSQEALQLVNDEKVDAYVGNLGVANYMSNFENMDNLKIASSTEYGNIQYSFIAPKNWPELATLLSKGFEKIPQVEHNAIAQKWFSFPTIEKIDYALIWKILGFVVVILLFFIWWNRTLSIEKNKTKEALNSLQRSQKKLKDKNDELAQSKLLLESVINENPNPIMIKNAKGLFVLVNKSFANLYGSNTVLMIDKTDKDFSKTSALGKVMNENLIEILQSDDPNSKNIFEDVEVVDENTTKHYMIIKKPFKNHKNQKHILVIANDITMIKALEDEKLQQQKFIFNQSKIAAMGDMVANIAHQWRQPLSVISTVSTGSKLKKEMNILSDEEFTENMEIINTNVQYLSSTIDTFRNFLKEEKIYKEVILQDRIDITLNIYGTAIKNHQINLINNIDYTHPIKIHLVVGELSQVLGNILTNAKDALLERKIEDAWIKLEMEKNDDFVTISVEDNAGGIATQNMPRIFEPYFTTKHSSQGTGLGLHMSYKIITESLNGKLYAQNTQNGAKFFIQLPLNKSNKNL